MIKLEMIPTGMIQTNCVILSTDDKQALVIDPGADAEVLVDHIKQHNLTVIGYPFTHGHYDHVCAIGDMYAALPAPCWMHPLDLSWAFTDRNQNLPWYKQPDPATVPKVQSAWETDGLFKIGPFEFETIFLPGHSPGSVGFYFPKEHLLIGGDVLFRGSVGRTDLPGGSTATLMKSLRRLSTLPPETKVISGHGPATTIGEELRSNPYMHQALS